MSMVRALLPLSAASQGWSQTPLASVNKVCVDKIAGDASVVEVARELAFATLYAAKLLVLTERCDKADAVLKGAVLERSESRKRSESEGIGFGAVACAASGGAAAIGGVAGSHGESLASSETRRQASVALRLVDREGTVIWAHSQDSPGGKTRSPVSDALDRAVKQLLRDIEKQRGSTSTP